jgi:transposase InsO family protein
MSTDFKEVCDRHRIKREYTIPSTPHQNGVVER